MTMKRNAKAEAQITIRPEADGYIKQSFASPKLRKMALADRGHYRMTPSEYMTHYLGRSAMNSDMAQEKRETLACLRRTQRVAEAKILKGRGRRRAPESRRVVGHKRPKGQNVERSITQK